MISAFMGLSALALYQNYYFIITALRMMLVVILNACMAGVGNKLVMESKEANYRDLERISLLFCWLLGVSSSMLLCLYQPFMQIWMGEDNMLTIGFVFCFVVYYYSMGANKLLNMFKDSAGIWKTDRWRPLTAALVNLTLNLATVQRLGLYGVLLSSVVSIVLIQIPWLFRNLFIEVFPRESRARFVRLFCGLTAVALLSCTISWFACSLFSLNVWGSLLLNAVISFLLPNLCYYIFFGRNPLLRESLAQIKRSVLPKPETKIDPAP